MTARTVRFALITGAVAVFGGLMFGAGWLAAGRPAAGRAAFAVPVPVLPAQAPLQEMIPFPAPGPGSGQGGEECEPLILFYHQGRLYRLMPGPQRDGQGRPGSPPEYFPLQPYQGPPIPGLPFQLPPGGRPPAPPGPGFQPVQPRF
jgi:hypothetical protein